MLLPVPGPLHLTRPHTSGQHKHNITGTTTTTNSTITTSTNNNSYHFNCEIHDISEETILGPTNPRTNFSNLRPSCAARGDAELCV